jgi:hypothetical protein
VIVMSRALLAALALVAAGPPPAVAPPATGPKVRCAGVGAPTLREAAENVAVARGAAERRARRAAREACRATVRALSLDGGGSAASSLDADRALADALEAALRRARVAGVPRFYADGGVALELELTLPSELATRVVPPR